MVYLEYEKETKYVVEIHESEPTGLPVENDYATSTEFNVGDEFKYLIIINEVNENKEVTSSSSIQQARSYSKILMKNQELKDQLKSTKDAVDYLLLNNL